MFLFIFLYFRSAFALSPVVFKIFVAVMAALALEGKKSVLRENAKCEKKLLNTE